MSSSFIPPVPPKAVKLNADGQLFWERYAMKGQVSDCKPEDVYVVLGDIVHNGREQYQIIQAHSYSSLWVAAIQCIPVQWNAQACQWEEIP